MSRYKKKHSPTHSHEEEEEGFAQTARSALSRRGLLDPIKPACKQSQLDGLLKLTVSAFNRLWISMPAPAVLVTVPTVRPTQNSLHPLSASSITAGRLLDFMVRGKITEADAPTIRLGATPSGLSVPHHLRHPPIFTPNAPLLGAILNAAISMSEDMNWLYSSSQ